MFADRLRAAIKASGLTIREFASAGGINEDTLHQLVITVTDPHWSTICRLADALGVATEVLRPGQNGHAGAPRPRKQRLLQLKRIAAGLCQYCAKPRNKYKAAYDLCAENLRLRARQRTKSKDGKVTGRGRPAKQ